MSQVKTVTLFDARTTTGTTQVVEPWGTRRTVQAQVVGTGAVTATLVVQISNDGTTFLDIGTIALSGTTSSSGGLAMDAAWRYMRFNLSAVTGTEAAVTAILGSHNG
jgi:hypothetical protein